MPSPGPVSHHESAGSDLVLTRRENAGLDFIRPDCIKIRSFAIQTSGRFNVYRLPQNKHLARDFERDDVVPVKLLVDVVECSFDEWEVV